MPDSSEILLTDRPVLSPRQRRLIWLFAPVVLGGLCMLVASTGAFDGLERRSVDWRFRQRGPLQPDPHVVIVEITEAARRRLTVPDVRFDLRAHLADAINTLADAGAVAIGLDFWLQGRGDPTTDAKLARAIAETSVVLGVAVSNELHMRGPSVFLNVGPDEGTLIVQPDPDGVLRRLPLLPNLDVLDPFSGEATHIAHMPFVLAYLLLADRADAAGKPLPALNVPPTGQARIGDRVVPYGQLVNYAAGPGQGFVTLDFADVALSQCDLSAVDGAVVLIGSTRSLEDQFAIPLSNHLVPGVYYHANVIDMILSNRPLTTWPGSRRATLGLVWAVGIVAGWYFFCLRDWWQRRAGWLHLMLYSLVGLAAFCILWCVEANAAFERRLVIPMVAPLVAIVTVFATGLIAQLAVTIANARRLMRRNRQIEQLFGRNVSDQVLAAIKADPSRIARTEVRDVSVLFCDVRGFTATSADMAPAAVADMLNAYFEAIASAVFEQDGFIDKFVGDELMAVFNAPLDQLDHASRAVRAATSIKRRLADLNQRRVAQELAPLACGVGICTGLAAAGYVGAARRANYTVVGEIVNTAARIEQLTTGGEILISQSVLDCMDGAVQTQPWQTVELRGLPGTHQLYEVIVG